MIVGMYHTIISTSMCNYVMEESFSNFNPKGCSGSGPNDVIA